MALVDSICRETERAYRGELMNASAACRKRPPQAKQADELEVAAGVDADESSAFLIPISYRLIRAMHCSQSAPAFVRLWSFLKIYFQLRLS